MSNWKNLIQSSMKEYGDDWANVINSTLTDEELSIEFDLIRGEEGAPFTVWTISRVYFPVVYDGSVWVDSVSRNPDGVATPHVGC